MTQFGLNVCLYGCLCFLKKVLFITTKIYDVTLESKDFKTPRTYSIIGL